MKPKRPNIIDRLQAKKAEEPQPAAPPQIERQDLVNLLAAARLGLSSLSAQALVHVAVSMERVEAVCAALTPAAAPPAPPATPPAAVPPAAATEPKKG